MYDEADDHDEDAGYDEELEERSVEDDTDARSHARDLRTLGIGLLLGAALGAGAALLLAPASGEDTRRQLRRGARRLYQRSGDAVSEWWDEADRTARRLKRQGLKRSRKVVSRVRDRLA